MLQKFTKRDRALFYHRQMPERIRRYLNGRRMPDGIINNKVLGWNGNRITIPVFGRDGESFCGRRTIRARNLATGEGRDHVRRSAGDRDDESRYALPADFKGSRARPDPSQPGTRFSVPLVGAQI